MFKHQLPDEYQELKKKDGVVISFVVTEHMFLTIFPKMKR